MNLKENVNYVYLRVGQLDKENKGEQKVTFEKVNKVNKVKNQRQKRK